MASLPFQQEQATASTGQSSSSSSQVVSTALPVLLFLQTRLQNGLMAGDASEIITHLGIGIRPMEQLDVGMMARTSGILVVAAGIGSYAAYRLYASFAKQGNSPDSSPDEASTTMKVGEDRNAPISSYSEEGFYAVRVGEDDFIHQRLSRLLEERLTMKGAGTKEGWAEGQQSEPSYRVVQSRDGSLLRLLTTDPISQPSKAGCMSKHSGVGKKPPGYSHEDHGIASISLLPIEELQRGQFHPKGVMQRDNSLRREGLAEWGHLRRFGSLSELSDMSSATAARGHLRHCRGRPSVSSLQKEEGEVLRHRAGQSSKTTYCSPHLSVPSGHPFNTPMAATGNGSSLRSASLRSAETRSGTQRGQKPIGGVLRSRRRLQSGGASSTHSASLLLVWSGAGPNDYYWIDEDWNNGEATAVDAGDDGEESRSLALSGISDLSAVQRLEQMFLQAELLESTPKVAAWCSRAELDTTGEEPQSKNVMSARSLNDTGGAAWRYRSVVLDDGRSVASSSIISTARSSAAKRRTPSHARCESTGLWELASPTVNRRKMLQNMLPTSTSRLEALMPTLPIGTQMTDSAFSKGSAGSSVTASRSFTNPSTTQKANHPGLSSMVDSAIVTDLDEEEGRSLKEGTNHRETGILSRKTWLDRISEKQSPLHLNATGSSSRGSSPLRRSLSCNASVISAQLEWD